MDQNSLRKLPVDVWIVTTTSFLTDISFEILTNLFPLFLPNVLKTGTTVIDLIDGIAETTPLTKVSSKALSDRPGNCKWPVMAGRSNPCCRLP
jgi:hypothetical protein